MLKRDREIIRIVFCVGIVVIGFLLKNLIYKPLYVACRSLTHHDK